MNVNKTFIEYDFDFTDCPGRYSVEKFEYMCKDFLEKVPDGSHVVVSSDIASLIYMSGKMDLILSPDAEHVGKVENRHIYLKEVMEADNEYLVNGRYQT